jgi:ankyrin repeat protein
MTEVDDISAFIGAAVSARNAELVKEWISWQRARNGAVSLDHAFAAGIETYSLDIVKFMGIPKQDLVPELAKLSCTIGYLDGVIYAFALLSESERLQVVQAYLHEGVRHNREIFAFFLGSQVGWRDLLIASIGLGDGNLVQGLLGKLSSTDSVNFLTSQGTPLGLAASSGDMNIVEQLLSVPRIDWMMRNAEGHSPFVLACRYGHIHVYEKLGALCGDFLDEDEYEVNAAFFWASQCQKIDVFCELMPFFSRFSVLNPNFHIKGTSAFITAASSGHCPLLQSLLQYPGIDVNDQDNSGCTALIRAVRSHARSIEFLGMLLADSRVDLNTVDNSGMSALAFAVCLRREEMVKAILGSGRCDLRDNGSEILARAILFKNQTITGLLLSRTDLDVNGPVRGLGSVIPEYVGQRTVSFYGLGRGPPRDDAGTESTSLLLATALGDVRLFNQICHHPTFDLFRSRRREAIFQSLAAGTFQHFQPLLNRNLSQRSWRGDSVLGFAIFVGVRENIEIITHHPRFDMSAQQPAQCLFSMARRSSSAGFDFLASVPDIDLNRPLPHAVNGFPDQFSARPAYFRTRFAAEPGQRHTRRASEGIPPLFGFAPQAVVELSALADPRLDLNQRGKHGQTVLFGLMNDEECRKKVDEIARIDLNATDRHDNTAIGCAILSQSLKSIGDRMTYRPTEFRTANENGDTPLTLATLRARRTIRPLPLKLRASARVRVTRQMPR